MIGKSEYICAVSDAIILKNEPTKKYKDGVHTSVWSNCVAAIGSTPSPLLFTSKSSD